MLTLPWQSKWRRMDTAPWNRPTRDLTTVAAWRQWRDARPATMAVAFEAALAATDHVFEGCADLYQTLGRRQRDQTLMIEVWLNAQAVIQSPASPQTLARLRSIDQALLKIQANQVLLNAAYHLVRELPAEAVVELRRAEEPNGILCMFLDFVAIEPNEDVIPLLNTTTPAPAASETSEPSAEIKPRQLILGLPEDVGQPVWWNGQFSPESSGRNFWFQTVCGSGMGKTRIAAGLLARAFEKELVRDQIETLTYSRQRIQKTLGGVRERFECDFAELYWKVSGDDDEELRLRLLTSDRQLKQSRELPNAAVDEGSSQVRSIVLHAARSGEGYYTNRCEKDPFYHRYWRGTRSEAAAPIFSPADDEAEWQVCGILNCESGTQGHFRGGTERQMEAAALELSADLQVYLAARSVSDSQWTAWHPERDGWSTSDVMDRWCQSLVDLIDPERADVVCFLQDPTKKCFTLIGSSNGVGNDFRATRTYPEGFLGDFVRLSSAQEIRWLPVENETFCQAARPRAASYHQVVVCPLISECQQRLGFIGVYLPHLEGWTDGDKIAAEICRSLPDIARRMANLYLSTERLRQRLALIKLRQATIDAAVALDPRGTPLAMAEAIRDVFRTTLVAPAATILGWQALPQLSDQQAPTAGDVIRCITTTGLIDLRDGNDEPCSSRPMLSESRLYAMSESQSWQQDGRTEFLWRHPNVCLRAMDASRGDELGLPPGCPEPHLRHVELLRDDSPLNGRRLLTMVSSCLVHPQRTGRGDIQIRVARGSQEPVFTMMDEQLFVRLQRNSLPSLSVVQARLCSEHDSTAAPRRSAWSRHWQRPLFHQGTLAGQERVLLADCYDFARQRWPRCRMEAAIVCRHQSAGESERYRIVAYQSNGRCAASQNAVCLQLASAVPELSWSLLLQPPSPRQHDLVTFRWQDPQQPDVVRFGVRVPVLSWSGKSIVRGVLAVDGCGPYGMGSDDEMNFTVDEAENFFLAGMRLGAAWGISDPVGIQPVLLLSDLWFEADEERGLEKFPAATGWNVLETRLRARLNLSRTRLFLRLPNWKGDRWYPESPPEGNWQRLCEPTERWSFQRSRWVLQDAFHYQVESNADDPECWRIPLYWGGILAGYCEVGNVPAAKLNPVIGQVVSAWSQFLFLADPRGRQFISKVNFRKSAAVVNYQTLSEGAICQLDHWELALLSSRLKWAPTVMPALMGVTG